MTDIDKLIEQVPTIEAAKAAAQAHYEALVLSCLGVEKKKRCSDCKLLEYDYDDSDGHIVGEGAVCHSRIGVSNLRQFPFLKTKCATFEAKRKLEDQTNDRQTNH